MAANLSQSVEILYGGTIFDDPASVVNRIVRRHFQTLGDTVANWIRQNAPVDLEEFRRMIVVTVEDQGADILARVRGQSRHSYFVEFGRGPGKDPPPEILLAWVHRHFAEGQNFNIVTRHRQLFRQGVNRYLRRAGGLHDYRRTFAPMTEPRMKLDAMERQHKQQQFWLGRRIGAQGLPGFHIFSQSVAVNQGQINLMAQAIGRDIVTTLWT